MKFFTSLLLSIISISCFAQNEIPIIKAKSKKVDIKVNGVSIYEDFTNSFWQIEPRVKPDIFTSEALGDVISFHTDLDSISVKLEENTVFDFVILLKKDSAFTQIKYQEPYLVTLKKASLYDQSQQRELPTFTYLNKEDKRLQEINASFNLDSIAGKGSEISKLLNVMHWVHGLVRHDGSSDNPKLKNAIDLVKICSAENRGVNCRMMATILNECYLAMGYKSRMVTCMPKPLEFDDCHVINTVFLENEKRWIWLDPTFDAYVMDETGRLLGIQEVRERLIKGEPLILNPTANWNFQNSQTKEYYLETYMAKNLYRLECPVSSTSDLETITEGKTLEYIQLLPLDGINQNPNVEVFLSDKSKVTYKTYITNNPSVFWEMF